MIKEKKNAVRISFGVLAAVVSIGFLSTRPGATDSAHPSAAETTSNGITLKPARLSVGEPFSRETVDMVDVAFEGSVDPVADLTLEAVLEETMRQSPMGVKSVQEIIEYRVEPAAGARYEVDVVFRTEDLPMPVRMASTWERDGGGEWTSSWTGAYNAEELLIQVSMDQLAGVSEYLEVLGYIDEISVARIHLPTHNIEKVDEVLAWVQATDGVEVASLHHLIFPAAAPNDPGYGNDWALKKIDPEGAWAAMPQGAVTPSGKRIIIGLVDNGHNTDNPDLYRWVNPGEVLNGKDSDGNNFVDDLYGWNFDSKSNDVNTGSSHGTQVARIAGAINNNGMGNASPAGHVTLLPAIYSASGAGNLFHALDAASYSISHGAKVVNLSLVGSGGPFWLGIARFAANENALLVAAAGNSNKDTTEYPLYPGSLNEPNVITVGASTQSDTKAGSSSFSKTRVHLFAPGSATSFSTPLVSSAAALLYAQDENRTWQEVKDLILAGVDTPSGLSNFSVSGGRLNLSRSITLGAGSGGSKPPPSTPKPNPVPEPEPINSAPIAKLTGTPLSGTAPLQVSFNASSSSDPDGDALTYAWTFGNGSTASGQANRSYTYTAAGTFTAKVTVSDGEFSRSATVTVNVAPEPTDGSIASWVDTKDYRLGVSAENAGKKEGLAQLVDGKDTTKWLAHTDRTIFEVEFAADARVIGVILVSGNDAPERDPSRLELISLENGDKVDVTVPTFSGRRQTQEVAFSSTPSGSRWRIIMHNRGGAITQLSEMRFVLAKPEPIIPAVPVLGASISGPTEAAVSWSLSTVVDTINLQYSKDGGSFQNLGNANGNGALFGSIKAGNLNAGSSYAFRARGSIGSVTGNWSAPVVVQVPMPEPEAEPEPEVDLLPAVSMAQWVQLPKYRVGVSLENSSRNEGLKELLDGKDGTKWLAFGSEGIFELELSKGLAIGGFVLVSGNDAPERDPAKIEFISHDTRERVVVTIPDFTARKQAKTIKLSAPLEGSRWRMIMRNRSGAIIQLAEFSLLLAEPVEQSRPSGGTGSDSGLTLKAWLSKKGYDENENPMDPAVNHQGAPLALVYALGLAETDAPGSGLEPVGESSAAGPRLPEIRVANGGQLEFVFWRNRNASEAVLQLESSTDLVNWTVIDKFYPYEPIPEREGWVVEDRGESLQRISLRASQANGAPEFFRVQVRLIEE